MTADGGDGHDGFPVQTFFIGPRGIRTAETIKPESSGLLLVPAADSAGRARISFLILSSIRAAATRIVKMDFPVSGIAPLLSPNAVDIFFFLLANARCPRRDIVKPAKVE